LTSFLGQKKNLGDQETQSLFLVYGLYFIYFEEISKQKFTCAQTKCKAIVVNVLSPYAESQILDDLTNIKYCCLAVDASNHIDLKIVPIIVRYFISDKVVATEIKEFSSLPGETSDLVDHILEASQKHDVADKITGISTENTNTNFGGLKRKGKNNILTKLQETLNR
jgi:hypothetical protein